MSPKSATDQERHDTIDFVMRRVREEGRVYEIAKDFVQRFQSDHLPLTKEAQSIKIRNEFSGQNSTIADYVAYLVSEYVKMTDVVMERKAKYDKSPDGTNLLSLVNTTINKEKIADSINAMWDNLRANNLIGADTQKKLGDCEEKKAELERKLSDLRVKYEGLRRIYPDATSEVESDERKE